MGAGRKALLAMLLRAHMGYLFNRWKMPRLSKSVGRHKVPGVCGRLQPVVAAFGLV